MERREEAGNERSWRTTDEYCTGLMKPLEEDVCGISGVLRKQRLHLVLGHGGI